MRVLVTGAGRGIGRAVCLRLAADAAAGRGGVAHVVACDIERDEPLDRLIGELEAAGARVAVGLGDLADPDTPARLVAAGVDAFGGLDAVVSNAGISAPARLLDLTVESWDRLFAINTRAGWLLAKAAHAELAKTKGSIVTVCSMSGMIPHTGMGAYSPSKAAMIMTTRLLAQEFAADGIRVNSVSPGFVHTSMTAGLYADPELKKQREAIVPLGHIADAGHDIAAVVAFLVGADARYVTGQNILADGGFLDSFTAHIPGRAFSGGKAE